MINYLPYYMLRSLACTLIIEILLSLLICVRSKKDLLNVALVNLITNPPLVITTTIINLAFGITAKNISIIFFEISVVLIEGFIYKKTLSKPKINPYLVSLLLNAASYGTGLIINHLF